MTKRTLSEDEHIRRSEAARLRWVTRDRRVSQSTRDKMARAQKERYARDPNERQRAGDASRAAWAKLTAEEREAVKIERALRWTAEAKAKKQADLCAYWASVGVEERTEHGKKSKAGITPEGAARNSAALSARVCTAATRARRSTAVSNSPIAAAARERVAKSGRKQTKIESAVEIALSAAEVQFEAEFTFGKYRVDFYLPTEMCAVEADGDYWHSRPDTKARDARKDIYLASLGIRVWRFPECDIKSGRAFKHHIFAQPCAKECSDGRQ